MESYWDPKVRVGIPAGRGELRTGFLDGLPHCKN